MQTYCRVMPDHIHWLFELGKGDLCAAVHRVKSRSASNLNRRVQRAGQVWQVGLLDRALRREEDVRAAARIRGLRPSLQGCGEPPNTRGAVCLLGHADTPLRRRWSAVYGEVADDAVFVDARVV